VSVPLQTKYSTICDDETAAYRLQSAYRAHHSTETVYSLYGVSQGSDLGSVMYVGSLAAPDLRRWCMGLEIKLYQAASQFYVKFAASVTHTVTHCVLVLSRLVSILLLLLLLLLL